jgi:hypothetical protein
MYEALLILNAKIAKKHSLPMQASGSPSENLLAPEVAARALGITVKTLANWRCLGTKGLSFVRVGGRIMYRQNEVDAFILAGKRSSTSDVGAPRNA